MSVTLFGCAERSKSRQSVYQLVTDNILEALARGVIPWRRPWGGQQLAPKSATTGRQYRGVNTWLLFIASEMHGYESPWWVTYKQAQALGGNVRKGERSSLVTFWKEWETEDRTTGDEIKVPVLRYFSVFNAAQCDGLGAKFTSRPDVDSFDHSPILQCERIAAGYADGRTVEHGGFKACYQPTVDRVLMPRPEVFEQRESYYATLFHELVHSTGHEKRLNRQTLGTQDLETYGREELIAEMGAALLCGMAGISPATVENSASYLAGWCKAIRHDCKLVIQSAAAAQRASTIRPCDLPYRAAANSSQLIRHRRKRTVRPPKLVATHVQKEILILVKVFQRVSWRDDRRCQ
jgi:antirestriction protein ArdC